MKKKKSKNKRLKEQYTNSKKNTGFKLQASGKKVSVAGHRLKFLSLDIDLFEFGLLFLFVFLGFVLLIFYKDLPIVRNSTVYARIIYNIDHYGKDFLGADYGYNKPLGLAYLTYPWYKLLGANIGLKVTSFIFTSLWAVSSIFFFNRFRERFNVQKSYRSFFLVLLCFNPLMIYQFISGYADMIYAFSFLWSFYFLDRILSKHIKKFDGILFGLITIFSIWVKHNGFIIFPILIIMLVTRYNLIKKLITNYELRNKLIVALISLLVVIGVSITIQFVDSPFFNTSQNSGNFSQGSNRFHIVLRNFEYFLVFLFLTLNVFSIFVFKGFTKFFKNQKEIYFISTFFFATLLFYWGTNYNIRYYMTLSPIFVLIVLSNLKNVKKSTVKVLLIVFLAASTILIVGYNCIWVSKNIVHFPNLDNLRVTYEQSEARDNINKINEIAKEQGVNTLYFISDYYFDAENTVWEKEGLFNEDLKIVYLNEWNEGDLSKIKEDKAILYVHGTRFSNDESALSRVEKVSGKVYIYNK